MHGWEEQHEPEKKLPIITPDLTNPDEVKRVQDALKDFAKTYQAQLDKEKRGGLRRIDSWCTCPHCIILVGAT